MVGYGQRHTHTPVSGVADRPLRNEPDESLACRAATNPAAMTELYVRYQFLIFQYCRHRISDAEQVNDIVSEIFLKVLAALARGTKIERFRSWIFTIAHNEIANAYRARRQESSLDDAQLRADPGPTPEDIAVDASNLHFLHTLMKQLKKSYRDVIELRLAGLTNPEIGEVLGKSKDWVEWTQHRAYKQLRKLVIESNGMGGQS